MIAAEIRFQIPQKNWAFLKTYLKILFVDFRDREEGEEKEGETLICCSTYSCIHWLLLVCSLTRDQTYNLGISGQYSNQLSYLARAELGIFQN